MTIAKNDQKIEEMLKAGMHFGYSVSKSHPKMKPFVFAAKSGTSVFDLEKTKTKLDAAKEYVKKLGKEKKNILFVGTKKEAKQAVEECAVALGMPFVAERWLGGTLTNFEQIKKRMDYLKKIITQKASGELEKFTKKERSIIDEKILKMRKYFDSLEKMAALPAAVVVIDTKKEGIPVAEAKIKKLPVVALLNSDCDIKDAKYPVPGNDSSISSVKFFLKEIEEAYKEGAKESGGEQK